MPVLLVLILNYVSALQKPAGNPDANSLRAKLDLAKNAKLELATNSKLEMTKRKLQEGYQEFDNGMCLTMKFWVCYYL